MIKCLCGTYNVADYIGAFVILYGINVRVSEVYTSQPSGAGFAVSRYVAIENFVTGNYLILLRVIYHEIGRNDIVYRDDRGTICERTGKDIYPYT